MIILPPLPTDPAELRAEIERLELAREAARAVGRLTPGRARQIARELSELRQAFAVAAAKKVA
jgi:hypothetical protein